MKTSLRSLSLLAVASCGLGLLGACTNSDGSNPPDQFHHSSGRPVNPDTSSGGQGVPGSTSTGANTQGTSGQR